MIRRKLVNTINQLTYNKILEEFETNCLEILRRVEKSNSFIRPENFRAQCGTELDNILKKYNHQLNDEQKAQLENDGQATINEIVSSYESYLQENKITRYSEPSGLDEDPYTYDQRTYYTSGRSNKVFSDYLGTNNSYSMADMVATITLETYDGFISTTLGELQTITYSIYQNKAPVRVLGNMNAKDWVFGPRTIAGSLVFAVFNKHWLMNIYDKLKSKGMKNWHYIADEIPPFDITISFANEYGYDSRMALYGVRLLNEGQSMATNDIYIENTYQFVANDIELMDSLNAYQSGLSRHRGLLISSSASATYDPTNTNTQVNPIDKEAQQESEETENLPDVSTVQVTEEEMKDLTMDEAMKLLRERHDAIGDHIPDDGELRDNLSYKLTEEHNKITQYYKNKEAEEKEKN